MCITFFYINPDKNNGKFKLILVMNRDEFHQRPTSSSCWQNDILAGRDQEPGKEGGTWLGMDKKGRIGFLTNIYTGRQSPGKGRGFLIVDFLEGAQPANDYLLGLSMNKALYSPFNLVLFEPGLDGSYESSYYCRGHPGCFISSPIGPTKLAPGCHGVSNHPIGEPYRKTKAGKDAFHRIIEKSKDNKEELIEEVFSMMADRTCHHPDEQMIKQGGENSPMIPYHAKLACIDVDISERGYGTRVTTLILVDHDNNVTYIERQRLTGEASVHEFKF